MTEAQKRMKDLIDSLPEQFENVLKFEIPEADFEPEGIVFAGMGGSAIAGDLLKILLHDSGKPVFVHRDYDLPEFVNENYLVITLSYSGNTEETLSAFAKAVEKNAKVFAVASGGKLEALTSEKSIPFVKIPGGMPPRTALGYLFGVPFTFLKNSGILKINTNLKELSEFLKIIRSKFNHEDSLSAELAEKFYRRLPLIYTSTRFLPIAKRWQAQLNENAKAFAHSMPVPEMNHNEITGLIHPEEFVEEAWALFIAFDEDNQRIKLRMEETKNLIKDSVLGSTFIKPEGNNLVERIFYAVYLGDYVSLYLALLYNEDPVAIPRIDELKRRLSK